MTKLILGIGIPGSGKTTTLKTFAEKYNYAYISPDDVRAEMGISHENPLIASDNPLTHGIWDEIRKRTEDSLKQGKTVVLDATFAKLNLRQEFINIARANGAEKVQGFFVDTPPEIAWDRISGRERKVPRHVFDERVTSIKENPPGLTDGFDSVFTQGEYENLLKIEKLNQENKVIKKELGKLK